MQLSAAVTAAVRTLRKPGDLLPFYLLGAAVPVVARTLPFLALGVAWLHLEVTGRLDRFREDLDAVDGQPPDPEANPDAFADWATELVSAAETLVTPTVAVLLVLSILAAIAVWLVLGAAFSAGQIATCFARLRGERGLVAGIAGSRRFWPTFLGLFLFEVLLWAAVTGVLAIPVAIVWGASLGATGSGLLVLAVPITLLAFLAWIAALLAIRALFAFAPVAVVVDERGVFEAVTASYGFVRARPAEALFYYVVALIALVGVTGALATLAFVGAGSLASLVSFAVVAPGLDLLKTVLYGTYRDAVSPPPAPDRSLRGQVRGGIRRGLAEMAAFVRATPGIHALVVLLGVASFWFGWTAAGPLTELFDASIASRTEGMIPPAAALEFFGNNWAVALTTAFSGIALAIPSLVSIAFNGVALGITARIEVAPLELLAFVVPHGLFEIPAIFIAGSVGVSLGLVWWRTARGRASRTELADALERAFWVLVGVGVLLAIAGFVEGFVSPFYYRPFL